MNCFKTGTLIALREKSSQIRNGLMLVMFFFMTHLMAQETVNGTVVDPDGVPLPGVNVVIKGTNSGTSTDFDGNFTINVPSDGTLSVSFIGYITQNISISGQTNLKVTLEENISALDEVVITGYGSQVKKSDLTGSISSISSEDFERWSQKYFPHYCPLRQNKKKQTEKVKMIKNNLHI